MTDTELHDLILGDEATKALADNGNDYAAAKRASEIAPLEYHETRVTYLSLAAEPTVGGDATKRLIKSIRTLAAADYLLDEVQHSLRGAGVDVAHASARGTLDTLAALTAAGTVPGGLTADDAAAIKTLGKRPPTITHHDVSRVWSVYRPNGMI